MRLYGSVLLAALLALTGVLFGLWWAPFVVGLAVPVVARRARLALPIGAAIGLFSWLVPLAAGEVRYGLGPTTQSLAAVMGFGRTGAVPVVLTLVVGTLLGLAGAWLASAAWAVVVGDARVDALRNE
ncbi:MAG TPA: hypothetical protein VFL27_07470 [Candidatus Dormibacteraeota bacterium]|nr:hypothetical protein [Candidatus Dormibacteraeota bacterium]